MVQLLQHQYILYSHYNHITSDQFPQTFGDACSENKGNLDAAVDSRSKMEKQTKSDNEVETLTGRWDSVRKVADDRITKVDLCIIKYEYI